MTTWRNIRSLSEVHKESDAKAQLWLFLERTIFPLITAALLWWSWILNKHQKLVRSTQRIRCKSEATSMKKMWSQQESGFAVFCFAPGIDNHFLSTAPSLWWFIMVMLCDHATCENLLLGVWEEERVVRSWWCRELGRISSWRAVQETELCCKNQQTFWNLLIKTLQTNMIASTLMILNCWSLLSLGVSWMKP